jgi:hypothetical protein
LQLTCDILVSQNSLLYIFDLYRYAAAAARDGVVQTAWLHDIAITASAGALLLLHVGVQSLRGGHVDRLNTVVTRSLQAPGFNPESACSQPLNL